VYSIGEPASSARTVNSYGCYFETLMVLIKNIYVIIDVDGKSVKHMMSQCN